jgi:hypothetical protein
MTVLLGCLLGAAAAAYGHDMAFPGPPPGAMPGDPMSGAMMGGMYPGSGMYPGMGPGFAGPPGYGGCGPFEPCGEQGPPVSCGPCEPRCPTWSFAAEAMLLGRSTAKDQVLVRAGLFNLAGETLLATENLTFDEEFAPRISTVLHLGTELDCSFSFLTVENWHSEGQVASDGPISVSAPNILLSDLNAARFDYDSDLWSAELNLRWRMMPRLTLLAGMRVIELNEVLQQTDNFPNLITLEPSYVIDVRNRMIGAQIGALANLLSFGKSISVDGFLKWGWLNNDAEHDMNDILNIGFGQLQAENTEVCNLVEVGVSATWRCNRHLKVWFGYEVLYLHGVATAPSQIPGNDLFDNATAIAPLGPAGAVGVDVEDDLWVSGVNGGFEVTY